MFRWPDNDQLGPYRQEYAGLLTYLANREWAVPSIEDFGTEFHARKRLNWLARRPNRFLLQSLTRQDWQTAARYLQTQSTPAIIDKATATLPPKFSRCWARKSTAS